MSRSTNNPPLSPIVEHPEGNEEAAQAQASPAHQQLNQSMTNLSLNNPTVAGNSSVSGKSSGQSSSADVSSLSPSNSSADSRGRRRRVRVSEASSPAMLSPGGPSQAKVKTRRRRRSQKHKLNKNIERVKFDRYIHSVFQEAFNFYIRPPRRSGSASPAEQVKLNPIRPPSGISKTAMSVLNTLVKDLIARFASETNKLLENSPLVNLDAPEAISAIRMMLGRNTDQFNTVMERFGRLSASMPSRRRVRTQRQPGAKNVR